MSKLSRIRTQSSPRGYQDPHSERWVAYLPQSSPLAHKSQPHTSALPCVGTASPLSSIPRFPQPTVGGCTWRIPHLGCTSRSSSVARSTDGRDRCGASDQSGRDFHTLHTLRPETRSALISQTLTGHTSSEASCRQRRHTLLDSGLSKDPWRGTLSRILLPHRALVDTCEAACQATGPSFAGDDVQRTGRTPPEPDGSPRWNILAGIPDISSRTPLCWNIFQLGALTCSNRFYHNAIRSAVSAISTPQGEVRPSSVGPPAVDFGGLPPPFEHLFDIA